MSSLRALLTLGRVSNLPTVWSNCLAGWWLGGGGAWDRFAIMTAGVTLMYLGGMFLNDAFDVEFDRQHRKERPIPSGAISLGAVWRWGLTLLGAGSACLILLGLDTGGLAFALLIAVLIYDAVHKAVVFSPVIMGICRFFVYVIAASVAANGVTGRSIWCGLALGCYVTGLSYVARKESARGPLQYWPLLLLGAPIGLAFVMNVGAYQRSALMLSMILGLWMVASLRFIMGPEKNPGKAVSGLLAGIVLVDLLASLDVPQEFGLAFLGLFLGARLFQRLIPAT